MQPPIRPKQITVKASELLVGDVISDYRLPFLTTMVSAVCTEPGLSGVPLVHVYDEYTSIVSIFGMNQKVQVTRTDM